MSGLDDDERRTIRAEFRDAVDMSPSDLEAWLETDESRSVGDTGGGGSGSESTGHASGRRIIAIKRTKVEDLDDDDHRHMRKVVGSVHRHTAQRPSGDVRETPWRYSLMNWGHDPLRG